MRRVRSLRGSLLIPALLGVAVLGTGCGGSEEQQVLQKYFQAARLRDNTTLANIATVSFNPNQDGIVRSFEVVNVEESSRPLRAKELLEAVRQAEQAEKEFADKMKAYQDENLEAIDRVLKAEREGGTVARRDLEVQAAWRKWRDEMAEQQRKVSTARSELSQERGVAEVSVSTPNQPVDVTTFDGQVITKNVTIDAQVQTPDNQTVNKTMVVQMQRATLQGPDGNEVAGRWIISDIEETGAAATS